MIMTDPLVTLQERITYSFRDISLLQTAMTHSSTADEENYERLEFLGDRVLGLVMADLLYHRYPQEREGDLAKRHAALVQGRTLAIVAHRIDLGEALILSEGERAAGGAENENMLADGMEALIGAMYLDGGLEPTARLIAELWDDLLDTMAQPPQDPKTALQEWAQARGLPLPEYELSDRSGPDHAPVFTVKVTVEGFDCAEGTGASRRAAEKLAAQILLQRLEAT
jgi:ribonuclease-3